MENPYQALMGDAWDELAPGVRVAMTPPLSAAGTMRITVANRGVAGLLARIIKLPSAGENVSSRLRLKYDGDGVRWFRDWGGFKAESLQRFRNGVFFEEAGPFVLCLKMEPVGQELRHVQCGARVGRVPVPAFLAPTVAGTLGGGSNDQSWTVDVEIGHIWLGPIVTYRGEMRTE